MEDDVLIVCESVSDCVKAVIRHAWPAVLVHCTWGVGGAAAADAGWKGGRGGGGGGEGKVVDGGVSIMCESVTICKQ